MALSLLLPDVNFREEKEPKSKLLSPDIFQWGRGLPRERVGAKMFDTSLETREIKLFGRDIPGFCRDIPGRPKSLRKKCLCSISVPYNFRKTREGWNCRFQKTPRTRKVGTRSWQCGPKAPSRFAFPGDRNPRICSVSRFGN